MCTYVQADVGLCLVDEKKNEGKGSEQVSRKTPHHTLEAVFVYACAWGPCFPDEALTLHQRGAHAPELINAGVRTRAYAR